MQKKDFTESGVGCIHYGQIYTYYGIFTDKTKSFVSPELAKTLKKVQTGDLIIASTSENMDDVCKTVAWLGDDEIVTGGHSTIFKHDQDPKYLSYCFTTNAFFDQKRKLAKGIKVIDMSGKDLAKISIPIPPLHIQREIVCILDKYSALKIDLETVLQVELEARKKQYEFYRNELLNFGDDVPITSLGKIAEIGTGSSNTNEGLEQGLYPFYVRSQGVRYKNSYEFDETAIITSGDGVGVGKIFHFVQGKYALHQRAYRIKIIDERIHSKFFF